MSENQKLNVSKMFVGSDRVIEPKRVGWMSVLYPRVNSQEYWKFRKANGNLTHHDYTVMAVSKKLAKGTSREAIVSHLVKSFVERDWKDGELDIQVAQYLGQLTEKGWNGLVNAIVKVLEGK